VSHEWLSSVTARARLSLGTAGIEERLSGLTRRVESLQAKLDEWPPRTAYLGDHTALVETRWGGILLIDSRESVLGPALLLKGLWEPDVTRWFQETLRPGQVLVDVGANIGYYSVLGSKLVGNAGHVFAVEAHPRMAELLHRNVIVNALHNVTTLHKAAWSSHDVLEFHMRRHFAANSSAGSLGTEGLQTLDDTEDLVKVEAEPLDDMLSDAPSVDVIKIDVEGAEVQVVNGLVRTLGAHPEVKVMFEWSPGQLEMVGNDPSELIGLMRGHGFRLRLMERGLAEVEDSELRGIHYANVVASRR
jgi:FkbM family methyltransferase